MSKSSICNFQKVIHFYDVMLLKEEIVDNHKPVFSSFGLFMKDEEYDLSSLYWTPTLHKCPYKQCCITGAAKCSTKPLSKL